MQPVTTTPASSGPWYSGVSREAWRSLVGSSFGWIFDGYETYALILVVAPAMHVLLTKAQLPSLAFYQGLVIGLTLLGWAIGGIFWGVITDYIGRRRAMIYSILVYAVFTGLTAFSHSWWQMAGFRFLTGLGLGAEWATGASMVSERFPVKARAKSAAILQSGFGVGFLISSVLWAYLAGNGPQAWRWMFVIGAIPALLSLLYTMRQVPESDRWEEVNSQRQQARAKREAGHSLSEHEQTLTRLTLPVIFGPDFRRKTWMAIGISFAFTCGWYAVSSWIPAYTAGVAVHQHLNPAASAAASAVYYNVAGIIGYLTFAFVADVIGRRPTIAIYFGMAFLMSLVVFLGHFTVGSLLWLVGINGFFSLGVASVFPVLLPELFPTYVRATGAAFIFNVSRLVAFLGPITAGALVVAFHGIPVIASIISAIFLLGAVTVWFLPETRGLPLPE